jgi:hypothetical protein
VFPPTVIRVETQILFYLRRIDVLARLARTIQITSEMLKWLEAVKRFKAGNYCVNGSASMCSRKGVFFVAYVSDASECDNQSYLDAGRRCLKKSSLSCAPH